MNSKRKVSKIIFLLIVVIIPLLAAFFIGQYGYKRYQDEYIYDYMEEIDENTKDKLDGYIKLISNSYNTTPIYEANIENNGNPVFRVEMYQATVELYDETKEETYLQVKYYVAVYNIDYEELVAVEDPTGEKKLRYNNIPVIYINITDTNDKDNVIEDGLKTTSTETLIEDYNATPDKDYRGNELNSKLLRWLEVTPTKDFSNKVEVEMFMTDSLDEETKTYHSVITNFTIENFEADAENINTENFEEGYDNDVLNANYFNYVFTTKLWWQSTIAFVLVGLITFSFYAVWNYEEKNEKIKRK